MNPADTPFSDSPDGRTRVTYGVVSWRMSHESYVPTLLDVPTGNVLAAFDDSHWDGSVEWTENGCILTLRYYPGETGTWKVEIDRTNDTFRVDNESGPLRDLPRVMARLQKTAAPKKRWFSF